MSRKKNIPDGNHLLRRIPWNKLLKDENDNVLGILGVAFKRREKELSLSANNLEQFSGTQDDQIEAAVKELRSSFEIKTKDRFAIGNVANIKATCATKSRKIHVISSPTHAIPSHVSINEWPDDDAELLESIAAESWSSMIANADIPD